MPNARLLDSDCFKVLEYMCKKMGIDIECRLDSYGKIEMLGMQACGMKLVPRLTVMPKKISEATLFYYKSFLAIFLNSHYGTNIFSGHSMPMSTALWVFTSALNLFTIDGLNLCIANPFFGFTDVLACSSAFEAKIAVDLAWPHDISRQVARKVEAAATVAKNDCNAIARKWLRPALEV